MKTFLFSGAAICASCSLLVLPAHSQPGTLDMTFNPGSGANAPVTCMALETNGQIVIGGDFTTFNGANQHYVARLNADGSVDSSFYPGVGPSGNLASVAVQSNGEILIAGQYTGINGLAWNSPALLRIDGSLDTSFNTSGANGDGVSGYGVLEIVLQSDGKVLIAGNFQYVNGDATNLNNIARLDTNGTVDFTFNPGMGANGPVNALGLQSTGQIIVGGTFSTLNGQTYNVLGRLNSNGSVDSSFNALIEDGYVTCLAVTPQNQIVIGGGFTSINGYSRSYIARLNAGGSLDTSFNPGLGANSPVSAIAIQPNGEVLISGVFTTFNGISVAGGLALLNTNGTLDTTFNPGTGPNNYSTSYPIIVVSQPDGKNLIAGNFTKFNGTNINRIARLNSSTSSTILNLLNPQIYCGMNLSGVASNTYRIESTYQFNTPSLWTPVFDVTLQTNPQFIFDPNPTSGLRFYRAVQISP